MALLVELLGSPRISRGDHDTRPLRGRKSWSLLAYLLLTDRQPSRTRLAELLFPDADDPLGALRWNLAELRRGLGAEFRAGGDPVTVSLPSTAVVDVHLIQRGHWTDAVGLRGLGCDLLEGMAAPGSAAFELWLEHQRRRLRGAAEAVLHQATLACLAAGDATRAMGHASRLVQVQPLDEAHHVLLVNCLRSVGDEAGAVEHVRRCTRLLGHEPAVDAAPERRGPFPIEPRNGRLPSVPAMLEAAEAAIAAGAVTQGLETLRQATTLARRTGDRLLLARVLMARGHALVHVGRGGDEEGGAALHEAAVLAAQAHQPRLAASAHRELAFADLQRGRYDRARASAARAARLAADDDVELAWIEAIDGACLSDQGDYGPAQELLCSAVGRAETTAAAEAAVFAGSFLGRLHLLRGQLAEAADVLQRAVRDARACWMAYSPWPDSLLAEAELRTGQLDAAEGRFERAYVMGQQLDDPCLESIAMRGRGLVAAARGHAARAYGLLVDAPRISRRLPDSYLWIEAYALDALCAVAIGQRHADATRWAAELRALAARCDMRDLLARALVHHARLGAPGALEAARELVAAIDSPALHAELSAAAA